MQLASTHPPGVGGTSRAKGRLSLVPAVLSISVGLIVLFGWMTGSRQFAALSLDVSDPIKASTALGLVFAGLALLCANPLVRWRYAALTQLVSAAITLLAGAGSLVFRAFETITPLTDVEDKPFRMSMNSALALTGLGISLITVRRSFSREGASTRTGAVVWVCQASALFAAAIGYIAVLGHSYNADLLYGFSPDVSMAFPSAVTVLVLGLGAFFRESDRAFAAEVTSPLIGGKLIRWVVAVGAIIIPCIGGIGLFSRVGSMIDARLGVALFAATNVALLATGMWLSARRLNQVALLELQGREGLSMQAVLLEQRVRDRTAELQTSEARFRLLADMAPALIFLADAKFGLEFVNAMTATFFGGAERALGGGWLGAVHPDDIAVVRARLAEAMNAPGQFEFQMRMRRHDGEYRWINAHGVPRRAGDGNFGGFIGACLDVTDAQLAKEELGEALANREKALERERILRREIDHRVRNNIASLLGIIACYETSPRVTPNALAITAAIRGKVRAMKEVHDLIAKAGGPSVDFHTLCERLTGAMLPDEQRGAVRVLSQERILLKPNQASALAIILQELLTNSFKHGALRSETGQVEVEWATEGDGQTLQLRWNETAGELRPGPPQSDEHGGLGLQLIAGLARSDLRGDCTFHAEAGRWSCSLVAQLG